MKAERITGILLISGVAGVLIPFIVLGISFDYPDILRKDAGFVLEQFQKGGAALIFTWLSFALLGLPLLIAYIQIGEQLKGDVSFMRWATAIGVISIVVQMIGLLRWVFVVPVLANEYTQATDPSLKASIIIMFKVQHQFAGVLLGEHIGQLFTIIWTVLISLAFQKTNRMPRWVNIIGYIVSGIYLIAQAELLATVIPGFPQWELAGLIGSTGWLIWLIIVGCKMIFERSAIATKSAG